MTDLFGLSITSKFLGNSNLVARGEMQIFCFLEYCAGVGGNANSMGTTTTLGARIYVETTTWKTDAK